MQLPPPPPQTMAYHSTSDRCKDLNAGVRVRVHSSLVSLEQIFHPIINNLLNLHY